MNTEPITVPGESHSDARRAENGRSEAPRPAPRKPYALTVGAALARATRDLAEAGIPDARLDAELLLAFVAAWERSHEDLDLRLRFRTDRLEVIRDQRIFHLTHPEIPLRDGGRRYETLVRERMRGRPVAYWLEAVEFMGLQFYVNRHVLIPRPETEIVVESALDRLRGTPAPRVLDVGTGSGCIALSLAVFRPGAQVWGLDVSSRALRVARKNARWLNVRNRFHWLRCNFEEVRPGEPMTDAAGRPLPTFHAVVSNPPYIGLSEASSLPQEVRREPPEALFSGMDGFQMINRLLRVSRSLLEPGGWLVMEMGHTQSAEVARRAGEEGWREIAVLPDLAGIPRVLIARA